MTYKLHYKNETLHLDKYCLMNSSMCGDKVLALLDTEEDLAYYALQNNYYKMHNLSIVCSYNDLYSPEGKKLNDNDLDKVIQKYFPEETKKIDNRIKLCNNKFVVMLMNATNWKLIKYWVELPKELIEKMPLEKKQKFTDIENQNTEYINEIETIVHKQKQEKVLAEKAANEATESNWKKFKKI